MSVTRKSLWMLGLTFVAYGLLVAPNEGEFWPFSIYPMFSQGGNPWSRAVVQEIDDMPVSWDTLTVNDLPGRSFPLIEHGVDPIDLANFVSKTRVWDDARAGGLQYMFRPQLDDQRTLLVLRVNGRLATADSIDVSFVPYAAISSDETRLNPVLLRH